MMAFNSDRNYQPIARPDLLGSAPPVIVLVSKLALIAQTPATASEREVNHSTS